MRRRSSTANASTCNELTDTIKFISNEPSLGLYYLQQHIQKSAPHLINLKRRVMEKSHETALHGEDMEDSIAMAKSMKECGLEVVDAMIREIENSLSTVSKRQLSLIKSSSGLPGRTRSEPRVGEIESETTKEGYLSRVLNSVKQRGGSLYAFGAEGTREEVARIETENLLIDPTLVMNERAESVSDLMLLCDGYDEFKASREAKLEEWLQTIGNESAL